MSAQVSPRKLTRVHSYQLPDAATVASSPLSRAWRPGVPPRRLFSRVRPSPARIVTGEVILHSDPDNDARLEAWVQNVHDLIAAGLGDAEAELFLSDHDVRVGMKSVTELKVDSDAERQMGLRLQRLTRLLDRIHSMPARIDFDPSGGLSEVPPVAGCARMCARPWSPGRLRKQAWALTCDFSVGARGFEPLTSSASRKRSTPELSARSPAWYRRAEAGTGIEPV